MDKIIVPIGHGDVKVGGGLETPDGKAVPTCSVCEKVMIAEMRKKYPLFNWNYAIGHAFVNLWVRVRVPKEKRTEGNFAVRKCNTCEKIAYRQMRVKSPWFNKFYKLLDATIEGWIAKFLTDEDKDRAIGRDPVHARELVKFNPRQYHKGQCPLIGIKFDGCIAATGTDGFPDAIGELIPGVRELITELRKKGAKIIIYGWRSNENARGISAYLKMAEKWLKVNQIPFDFFYDGKGPLIADAFVSTRNLGGSLEKAFPTILGIVEDPNKNFLQTRHVL